MWLPLVQTLACLSLINGGLYALHLNGNSNSGSSSSSASGNSNVVNTATSSTGASLGSHHNNNNKLEHSLHPTGSGSTLTANQQHQQQQQQHLQHLLPHALDAANSRYGEQLADMAQLERERLMLLGLAKQTAAAGAAATGHHGRPIVTGRIQMTPAEDAEEGLASSGSDYPSLFMQQARGFMFGNVVKQPKHLPADDYDSAEYEDADADALPRRYEYGRVVQPPPLLDPQQQQHHQKQQQLQQPFEPRRHDSTFDWQVLDAEPDVEDIIPDLDSYQYLDELLAEQQLQDDGGWHHWPQQHEPQPFYHGTSRMQQNPYHSLDELESNPPASLQELFEQVERQPHVGSSSSSSSTTNSNKQQKPHYEQSTRMQQKWKRKRAQQQFLNHQKLQQHFKHQQQQQHLQQQQQQRFGMQHNNKLPLASTLNLDESVAKSQQQKQHSSATSSSSNAKPADKAEPSSANAASSASANAVNNNQNKLNQLKQQDQQHQQQQQQQHLLHPNHKRSGLGAGNVGANGYSPLQPPLPPVTHSIASQLMLRTARGQRQYDVPQIECPTAMDGMERFACPTPDLQGRYRCIDDHVLCDGFIDCPEGEDEDRRSCMFYKTTKAHLDVLADALLRWARGR